MRLFKSLKYLDIKNKYNDTFGQNTPNAIIAKVKPFVRKKIDHTIEEIKLIREKLKDIPGTNYALGLHHLRHGNLDDAIMRFKMVIWFDPQLADAYYNLGRCLLIKGNHILAEKNLQKALSLKNDFPEAAYTLGKINSPKSLDSIPENTVTQQLEWRQEVTAEEKELRENCDKLLINLTLANIADKNPNLDVLDLGCSTGGKGKLLRQRELAKKIVGVDLYTKAINEAGKEKFAGDAVYNNLHNEEISKYLSNNNEKFDLALASNVFSYQGNLDNIFNNIAKALKQDGIFAAIIDKPEIEQNYKLDIKKDKFIHSASYFEEILKNSGFIIIEKREKEVETKKCTIFIAKLAPK